jgi:hypothetical protein
MQSAVVVADLKVSLAISSVVAVEEAWICRPDELHMIGWTRQARPRPLPFFFHCYPTTSHLESLGVCILSLVPPSITQSYSFLA